jgi:5-methylcytosine-specific restriction endonuclease McrA
MGYKDKDKQRASQLKWVTGIRDKYIIHLGGKCVVCESVDRLEFDHIDPSKKTMNPTRLWSRKEEIILAEIVNMQLLCHDCHKEKTIRERMEKRNLQHGEYGMYKARGCRCDLCRAANAERVRMQRAGISMRKSK